jgi:Ser/Thr protein kinase RdoA (MazF antagonist)
VKHFRQLARRGRLLRFRELATTALASYGLEDARLRFIQYNENAVYRVDGSDPAANDVTAYLPNRYVLRIHAMGDSQAIASELSWLAALNNEAGLPVPAPVPTLSGRLLATVVTAGLPQGRVVSLLRWLDGKNIQKGLRPDHLTALGQVVAQLHNFSAGWQPPAEFVRPT